MTIAQAAPIEGNAPSVHPQMVEVAAVPLPAIAEDLRQRFQADITIRPIPAGSGRLHSPVASSRFYDQRGYQPAWLNAAGPSPLATELLQTVAEAERDGLRPADYHLDELDKMLAERGRLSSHTVARWADLDLLLTDAWLTYGSHLLAGRLDPRKVDRGWGMRGRSQDLVPMLQAAIIQNQIHTALETLAPPHPGYNRLRTGLARYQELEKTGGWAPVSPGPKLEKGSRSARVKELHARLLASGDLTRGSVTGGKAAPPSGTEFYDEALAQAVRRFQRRHGLPEDGAVGAATLAALNVPVAERRQQIELNMERWRWLPEDLGRRYILVNITDYTLSVIEAGREVMKAKVIVGQTKRPTPAFSALMSYVVLNPRWDVPPTIAIKDKLPKLRRDAYALSKQRIRIYDTRAKQEIDPGSVDWSQVGSTNFHYHFHQEPGPDNALGKIKFMFPNPHNVYIHDTPTRKLFERDQRTFSSGCIRLSKPIELAEYLLKDNPRWTRETIIAATQGKQQRVVNLAEKIPVYLVYWTAWVDEDGETNFRNDIYDQDELLVRAWTSSSKPSKTEAQGPPARTSVATGRTG